MLKQFLDWLGRTPTTRPADVIEFEKSRARVHRSSATLVENADEMARMIERIEQGNERQRRRRTLSR
jgi:hypothetical protein